MVKRNLVIWSGGADSTLLLENLARKEEEVYAISFEPSFITVNKLAMEHKQREKLKKEFKDRGYNIQYITIKVETDAIRIRHSECGGLTQPVAWALMILPYLCDGDILNFGYIKGDDFWHFESHFRTMLDSAFKVLGIQAFVEYPLKFTSKATILKELHARNLLDFIWSCQLPRAMDFPCKNCHSCKKIEAAFIYLVLEGHLWAEKHLQTYVDDPALISQWKKDFIEFQKDRTHTPGRSISFGRKKHKL